MSDCEMSPMSLPSCMYSSEHASNSSSDCPTSVKQMDMMLVKQENQPANFEAIQNEAYPHRSPPNYMDAVYQNGCINQPNMCVTNQPNMCVTNQPNMCVTNQPNMCVTNQPNLLVYMNTNRTQNGVVKRKRIRTAFTTNQLQDLEDQYRINRYLERGTRIFLSRKLNVSERVIKIWFQNRRMKEKKDRSECQIVDSCTLPASSSNTQEYEPPFAAYSILPQANTSGLMSDSYLYEQSPGGVIAPMMAEHVMMGRPSEPPTAAEAHFPRYHTLPPPYESEVSSTVFSDFSQYCDAYNAE